MGNIHVKLYEILDQWFRRRSHLKKKITDRLTHGRQTNDVQRPITIAHLEPLTQLS